jgi:hypothetical protein
MAVIHNTTMTPGKLELLASWLPLQPWYTGTARGLDLAKAGGFRLDDPQGEVGIEFIVVTDGSGGRPVAYQVPLTYRGAPLDGADKALIGTAEHGVLGRRWIYDGTGDPVLVAQLLALLEGRATPQDQNVSDTPEPSVTAHFVAGGLSADIGSASVVHGPRSTDLVVERAARAVSPSDPTGSWTIRVMRILQPNSQESVDTTTALGHVTAGWRLPDGDQCRGLFVVVRES